MGRRQTAPLITAKANLRKIVGRRGFAGFTAVTGGATVQADLLSWSLH